MEALSIRDMAFQYVSQLEKRSSHSGRILNVRFFLFLYFLQNDQRWLLSNTVRRRSQTTQGLGMRDTRTSTLESAISSSIREGSIIT